MKKTYITLLSALIFIAFVACSPIRLAEFTPTQKDATKFTQNVVENFGNTYLDFNDQRDFDFASRNLLEKGPELLEIRDNEGNLVWSQAAYAFVKDNDPPSTVNPSLWRNTQLNHYYGLFKVVDGIYQVRGYDIINLTVIAAETGWIVFDPLMSIECARAAWELFNQNSYIREKYNYVVREEDTAQNFMPITAVVYSHPHGDHFGGVRGIFSDQANGNIPTAIDQYLKMYDIKIIAPKDFETYTINENVYAGIAMLRRAEYQYGVTLTPSIKGTLAMGIGLGTSNGTASYISPNFHIGLIADIEKYTIDGLEMEFQMTYNAESPVEIHTWFPSYNALWIAENCNGTLHNLYTLRGAVVRDGNAWAGCLMEAFGLHGKQAEVVFMSHTWPRWGNEEIQDFLLNTAAIYKFINDQSLLYLNMGYTGVEIANKIKLPDQLEKPWFTRQYYGTVSHNSRAVYQRFLGWYDGNPVNLNRLNPGDNAKKMVEYFGNASKIMELAEKDFEKGEYQWVAEITYILYSADPKMKDPATRQAQLLCADALEQLGYQQESGTWRNSYLTAALELRNGKRQDPETDLSTNGDSFRYIPPSKIFDLIGIRLDSMKAQHLNNNQDIKIGFVFTNPDVDDYLVIVRAGVLLYLQGNGILEDVTTSLTLSMPKEALGFIVGMIPNAPNWKDIPSINIVSGDPDILDNLLEFVITDLPRDFGIILPSR